MKKKIIKAIWLDCLFILLVVGVGVYLVLQISINLIIFPFVIGIAFFVKPYVKIRKIVGDLYE